MAPLATDLRDSIVAEVPGLKSTSNSKDVLAGNYAVLREENVTSALVEMGYLTNADDLNNELLIDSVQSRIAEGLAHGIFDYFHG